MNRKKTKTAARRDPEVERAPFGSGATEFLPREVALLAYVAPAVPGPSAKVKRHLVERIRATKAAPATAVPVGWRFESARAAEGWRQTFPGVRFKTLSIDEARDVVMLLVEMRPGARFPDHPHAEGAEEGLLISGDVEMDGRKMLPGDYYHAGAGTTHVNITSPSGCTALLSLRASAWRMWRETFAAR
jgi:anti-sigma factor ChrR (cupin superfamily)